MSNSNNKKFITIKSLKVFVIFVSINMLVACGGGSTSDSNTNTETETPTTTNSAPTANAGTDQNVETGSTVTLDASSSSDPDNDTLTYSWTMSSIPNGSSASLNNSTSATPEFTADIDGEFTVILIVNDGTVDSAADTVLITSTTTTTTTNSAPTANAGTDQNVETGSTVTLDASSSSDPDNDSLTYSWTMSSTPNGSTASLNDSTSATPEFTADVDGEYTISLIVNDGTVDSAADTVLITSSTTTSVSRSYAIVDTNQTTCYGSDNGTSTVACTNAGEDGSYSGNQASYQLSNSGETVLDLVTGLTWTQTPDLDGSGTINVSDKKLPDAAVTYCDTLTLDGRSDWRLPTIKEQYSLMQFTGRDPSGYNGTDSSALVPFIDDSVFGVGFGDTSANERIIDGQYATTSIYTSTTMNGNETMFGVNFVDGRIKGYPTSSDFYVFCVAGNTDYGDNDYTDNNDSTISDAATGLMWQQQDYHSSNWQDAIEHCETADTGNYNDWRLPDVKELHSLVDYNRSPAYTNSAAIDPIFTSTSFTNEGGSNDWGSYWSSTSHVNYNGSGTAAAYVSFGESLGYWSGTVQDVHGAGAQRSDNKVSPSDVGGASSLDVGYGTFYYHGPQGDILRSDNYVRCVRDN